MAGADEGNPFQPPRADLEPKIPDLGDLPPDAELGAYVGRRAGFYLHRWKRTPHGRASRGWNWAAALFDVPWFFYRGMYKEGFLLEAVEVAGQILVLVAGRALEIDRRVTTAVTLALFLATGVAVGSWANALYLRKTRAAIRGLPPNLSATDRLKELARKGGVSNFGVVLAVALRWGLWLALKGVDRSE